MCLKYFILFAAVAVAAYAASETVAEVGHPVISVEGSMDSLSRQKRFLLSKLLMKKAFLVGGALGLGAGVLSGRR